MGGKAIMPEVVEFLASHAGQPVTLPQLTAATGIEGPRIQKALSNAIGSGVYGEALTCVNRGRIWMWKGDGTPAQTLANLARPEPVAAPLFERSPVAVAAPAPVEAEGLKAGDVVEVIGKTRAGDVIARDGDGTMYRVSPL